MCRKIKKISIHDKCECGKTIDVEITVSEEPEDGLDERDVLSLLGFDRNGLGKIMCNECIRRYFFESRKRLVVRRD